MWMAGTNPRNKSGDGHDEAKPIARWLQRFPVDLNRSMARQCTESAVDSWLAHFLFAEPDATSAENALN